MTSCCGQRSTPRRHSVHINTHKPSPANIQIVGSVLGRLGYEIIPAFDGPSALKRLGLRPPDLILLDLLMPEMDGMKLAEVVRQLDVLFKKYTMDKDICVELVKYIR